MPAFRVKYPRNELIRIGATVYHLPNSTTRTLITYWPNTDEQPVTLWSSADFSLLWGFASFIGSDGKTRKSGQVTHFNKTTSDLR